MDQQHQNISSITLHIRAITCEECNHTFHEIPEALIDCCPNCSAALAGQDLVQRKVSSQYELRVDPHTGNPYLFDTIAGQRLDTKP